MAIIFFVYMSFFIFLSDNNEKNYPQLIDNGKEKR